MTDYSDIRSFLRERKQTFLDTLRSGNLNLETASALRYSVREVGSQILALDEDQTDPVVDESKMTATFTISTARVDRYGDVVLPRGCEKTLANYIRNPQVFFSHKSASIPIAVSSPPEVSEGEIRATGTWHEETEEARVTWRLVKAGVLRATSIGFLPIKASIIGSNKEEEELLEERLKKRKEKTDDGEKILTFDPWMPLRFLEWDLLEWSVVPVPANPDCCESLTKFLSDGEVEGERITPGIRKALEPFALKARVWSPGFDPAKVKYSGVLMLGDEELEYKEGKLARIGETEVGEQEVEEPQTPVVSIPVGLEVPDDGVVTRDVADETVELDIESEVVIRDHDEDPNLSDEEKENDILDDILKELIRHHSVEEAHQKKEEETFDKILAALDALRPQKSVDPVIENKLPEVSETKESEGEDWKAVVELLNLIKSNQKALDDKLFSLTGEE